MKFIHGHQIARKTARYKIEDRGYLTPCWIWLLFTHKNGYGMVTVRKRRIMAHIDAWEQVHGPVPDGKQIHHKCEITNCVNPDHLEALTDLEHKAIHVAERTHCSFGHEWTPESTYVTKAGARYCRICKARRSREFEKEKYWRLKGAQPPVRVAGSLPSNKYN